MADAILSTKKCRRCGGLFSGPKCRPCTNAAATIYRTDNRAKVNAAIERAKRANPEKYKAMHKEWEKRNERLLKKKRKAYLSLNADRVKKQLQNYQSRNADKLRHQRAYRYEKDKSRRKAVMAAWYARNAEKVKQSVALWAKANPHRIATYGANRRARVGFGKLSPGFPEKLFILQRGRCACCGTPLGAKYDLDHIVPLSRGGMNVDSNMQLLTKRCNNQKRAKDPIQFMQERGFLI